MLCDRIGVTMRGDNWVALFVEVTSKNQAPRRIGNAFAWLGVERAIADPVLWQASSFGASEVRVRPLRLRWASGRVPVASDRQRSSRREAASLIASMGTLNTETFFACDARAACAQWWL